MNGKVTKRGARPRVAFWKSRYQTQRKSSGRAVERSMLEEPNRCESLPRSSAPGVARPGEGFLHNKNVNGLWKDGILSVRPLKLTNPDDKALTEGKVYNFSFAVHDDNITTRGHQVSFPITVGFGGKAAIEATKLN